MFKGALAGVPDVLLDPVQRLTDGGSTIGIGHVTLADFSGK